MAAKKKASPKAGKAGKIIKRTAQKAEAEAAAVLDAVRARRKQLKMHIKSAKKELREVRQQLKVAKEDARKRVKAARAQAKKHLVRLNAAANRKRAALAKKDRATPGGGQEGGDEEESGREEESCGEETGRGEARRHQADAGNVFAHAEPAGLSRSTSPAR